MLGLGVDGGVGALEAPVVGPRLGFELGARLATMVGEGAAVGGGVGTTGLPQAATRRARTTATTARPRTADGPLGCDLTASLCG
jgi:hypothetical protein